jgi:hypothetical protein
MEKLDILDKIEEKELKPKIWHLDKGVFNE